MAAVVVQCALVNLFICTSNKKISDRNFFIYYVIECLDTSLIPECVFLVQE